MHTSARTPSSFCFRLIITTTQHTTNEIKSLLTKKEKNPFKWNHKNQTRANSNCIQIVTNKQATFTHNKNKHATNRNLNQSKNIPKRQIPKPISPPYKPLEINIETWNAKHQNQIINNKVNK